MIYTRSNEYEEKVTVEAGDYATFTNHDTGTIVQGRITAMMKNPYMDGVDFVKVNGVAVSLRSESWDVTLIERPKPELVFEPGLYVQTWRANDLDSALVYQYRGNKWTCWADSTLPVSTERDIRSGVLHLTKLGPVT